ncbi:MAG: type VI secretion system baseplate subunit TssF [Bilophila sp.]
MQERLDQGSPELIQALMRLLFPQALLPVTSSTLIHFQLQQGFVEPLSVVPGTAIASTPVDGVSCTYSTTAQLTVLPLHLTSLEEQTDTFRRVGVRLTSSVPLKDSLRYGLRLHLSGSYDPAVQRFYALLTQLDHVEVRFDNTQCRLPASCVRHAPLPLEDARLPALSRRNHSYMEAIRYFSLPQQLLFIQLDGVERLPCPETTTSMEVRFCLKKPFENLPSFTDDWAMLNVIPADNVFSLSAEPLTVDHTQEEYLIRPHDAHNRHIEILSIEKVTALLPGGRMETCAPYEMLTSDDSARLYSLCCHPAGLDGKTDHLLTLLHRPGETPDSLVKQTLSIALRCCNLALPSRLRRGDINRATDSSPAQTTFTNIVAPTPTLPRVLDEGILWNFLSHINTNLLSSNSAEALRAMLELYVPKSSLAPELAAANKQRCAGIVSFTSVTEDRLFRGSLLRGQCLHLTLNPVSFSSRGDMFLFAGMIDRFLAGYATINSYFRLALKVTGTGETYQWTPRLGEKQLL